MAWDLGQSNHLNTGSAAIVGAIVGLFGACLRVWCSRVSTFKMFSSVLSWLDSRESQSCNIRQAAGGSLVALYAETLNERCSLVPTLKDTILRTFESLAHSFGWSWLRPCLSMLKTQIPALTCTGKS